VPGTLRRLPSRGRPVWARERFGCSDAGPLTGPSKSCAGGPGQGITSGAAGWTTVTLPAGRYHLVCNLPNHYANGMHQQLTVR